MSDPAGTELPLSRASRQLLGRNLSALASGQVGTWTMTCIYLVVVPRVLGPDQMGVLTAAWSTAALFGAVLGLGTKNYLAREIAARPHEGGALLGTGMLMRTATIPVFFATSFAYSHLTHLRHQETDVLYLATLAVSLTFPAEALQAFFQATEKMHYLALGDVLSKTVQAVVGIAIALVGLGAAGVSVAGAGAYALVLVLSLSWARRVGRIAYRPTAARLQEVVSGSLRYWVLGLFLMIYLWIDTVMLSRMAPNAVVAWYGAATRLFQAFMFVPTILVTAWLPRMVAASARGARSLHRSARRPMELVILLGLPIAIGTAMTAGPVVRMLFGRGYTGAITPLVVLGFCLPLVYLNTVMANVFVAAKRPLAWSWVMVLASILNPLLNFVLIRHFQVHDHNGAIGAALSLALTELAIFAIGVAVVGRKLVDSRSARRIVRVAAAGTGMWAAMYAIRAHDVVIVGVVGVLVYGVLAVVLRAVPADEVGALSEHLPGRRRRSDDSEDPG